MLQKMDNRIHRRADGSLDIGFYGHRAARLRNIARQRALRRIVKTIAYWNSNLARATRRTLAREITLAS